MSSISTLDIEAARVRPATVADVPALADVGPTAYREAYGSWWTDADALARHVESSGSDAFFKLLEVPQVSIWIAERGSVALGFLTMHRGQANPATHRMKGVELRRIYLLQSAMGLGLGRAMTDAATNLARAEGHDHAWLDVMAEAEWAVRAYRRWGFTEIGRKQFHNALRGDLREMIVMMRSLD